VQQQRILANVEHFCDVTYSETCFRKSRLQYIYQIKVCSTHLSSLIEYKQSYHTALISKICPYFEVLYYVLANITVLISKKCP